MQSAQPLFTKSTEFSDLPNCETEPISREEYNLKQRKVGEAAEDQELIRSAQSWSLLFCSLPVLSSSHGVH